MEKGLKEKTGKSLAEWVKIVKKTKLEKHDHQRNERGENDCFLHVTTLVLN